jgi:S1-C subfamily serine protease
MIGEKTMRFYIFVIFTLCILCLSTLTTAAEDNPSAIPRADAVTFLGTENAAAELLRTVFAIHVSGPPTKEGNPTWILLGSGFFMPGPEVEKDRYVIMGITCKHVIDSAEKLNKKLENKEIYIGLDTDKGYQRWPAKILFTDPANDIAVLVTRQNVNEVANVQSLLISKELFDDGTSLVEGRGVLIIGYPLSLGIEDDKNHPVVRFGMIAQNTSKNTFLIDGVSSHGNSGSPVFTLRFGKNRVSGMISSFESDNILLFDENQQVRAQLPYNSGLSRAIKLSLILEAINEAKKKL